MLGGVVDGRVAREVRGGGGLVLNMLLLDGAAATTTLGDALAASIKRASAIETDKAKEITVRRRSGARREYGSRGGDIRGPWLHARKL